MGWNDKPTDNQLNTLYHWIRWRMPTAKAMNAIRWLENNATRKEVSDEMARIRSLYSSNKLDEEECFSSNIWDDYPFKNKINWEEE